METMAGTRAPVRMWVDPNTVEYGALNQVRNVANLPWTHGVAVMPDAHYGKGATVGSVIAMRDAVSPAAVGVDIGCVDGATEYLSPTGWRRIDAYDGGRVMQYEPATGTGRFVQPDAYVVKDCPEFIRLRTRYGIDQMLSPDHRMLVWRIVGRDRRREQTVMTAAEFETEHARLSQGFKAEFRTTFTPQVDTKLPMGDEEIRVQVMVHADGHIDGRAAVLSFKKARKIQRARALLTQAGIEWTEHARGDGVTTLRFRLATLTKTYDEEWWEASPGQLAIIADEVLYWDGNQDDRCYFTRDRASADFIHYVFTATGSRAVLRADAHPDGATDYRVFAHSNVMTGMAGVPKTPTTREPSIDGRAYCFTLPSGFWVMRRGGNIAMTGNCGMSTVRVHMTVDQLPDDLGKLRTAIEAAVPVGTACHNAPGPDWSISGIRPWAGFIDAYDDLTVPLRTPRLDTEAYKSRVMSQIGTLGGGNHFIEVCSDTNGGVWLMLHSGSRNVGKELAERHISTAKELPHNQDLPDRDLAVFLAGTPEMQAYRRDLGWAQEYAYRNRAVMMGLVKRALCYALGYAPQFGDEISCHHNYVSEETYDGLDLLITRKGAISTDGGRLGIIPGSMGTGSYIVRGLANDAAFRSASHGAGRRMSRAAAKRQFTVEDLAAQTAGVECRKDQGVVDEIPAAYKDLESVMAQQTDLVQIVHKLTTLVCVKG